MAKILTTVELNKKDLLNLVCKSYGIDVNTASVTITHFRGDQREGEHTSIKVTGVKHREND